MEDTMSWKFRNLSGASLKRNG